MTLPKNHKLLTGSLSAALALGIAHPVAASGGSSASTHLDDSTSIEVMKSHSTEFGDLAEAEIVDPANSFSSPFDESAALDEELAAIQDGAVDGDSAADDESPDTPDTPDSVESAESAESVDSVDSVESVESVDSVDSVESVDSVDSADSADDVPSDVPPASSD